MAKQKIIFLTVAVFLIAIVFRFWKLADVPKSLSMDEIAVGWNAYSILKTGKDEFGKAWPLYFRSIGDYKTPVAIYLVSPSIAVFGLTEFAVRFPAALLGSLTAVVFIFLLRQMGMSWKAAFAGGLFVAINPWHVFLSRTSFDGIIALFLLVLGVAVFLKAVRNKSAFLLSFSFGLLAMSVWSYHAERVFVPVLAAFLVIYFKPKKLVIPILVTLLFAIPFVYATLSGPGIMSRAADLWIGRQQGLTWPNQYLNYFDLNLWFFKGLNLTLPGYPDLGFLYVVDLPVFLVGLYAVITGKNKSVKALALFWFLIGPLPGSLTTGGINPGRTVIWLPFFGIVMASGFEFILEKKKKLLVAIYLLLLIWNIGYFADMAANNFTKYYADLWHYGYKEAALYACGNHDKYKKIIITDKYGIEWPSVKTIPYLYILFYCKWDPATYLKSGDLFNIEFRQPQWRIDSKEKNYLLIGSRWDFPEDFDKKRILKTIYFPDSAYEPKAAFYFVETNGK